MALGGGLPSHSSSISRSAGTTSFRCSRRRASKARRRPPPISMMRSPSRTSSGPRTRNSISSGTSRRPSQRSTRESTGAPQWARRGRPILGVAPCRALARSVCVRTCHGSPLTSRPSLRRPRRRHAPARGRPRVRVAVAAAVRRRGARRTPRAKPTLVVAGDDRQARDLAADLRAWLAPRPVRFYPSRGVTYESHLAPPPHLVGLRVAALDALIDEPRRAMKSRRSSSSSAVALSEKVPDPELRPHGFTIRKGDLIDLDEIAQQLTAMGYERVDQVEDRGQFAIRGGILDVYPATERPRRPRRPLRHRDRVAARVLDVHPAQLRRRRRGRDRPGGRARRRASRAGRDRRGRRGRGPPGHRRAAAGRPLPRLPRPRAAGRRGPHRRRGGRRAGAARPLAGRLRRLPRRRRPPPLRQPGRDPGRSSTSAPASA